MEVFVSACQLLFCSMLTLHIATVLPLDALPLLMPSVKLLVCLRERAVFSRICETDYSVSVAARAEGVM